MWHLLAACVLSLCSTDPLDKLAKEVATFNVPAPPERPAELERLEALVFRTLGVVIVEGAPEGFAGIATSHPRIISLSQKLTPAQRYEVLAHEAAHVLQPDGLTTEEEEVFAEAVALLVTGNNSKPYAKYLAWRGAASSLRVLKTHRKEIRLAARVLGGK